MTERISIKDILSSETVGLRATSDAVMDALRALRQNYAQHVELDFSEIQFVSRSFAHALITDLDAVAQDFNVAFANMADEVAKMLQLVRSQKQSDWPKYRADLLPDNLDSAKSFFDDDVSFKAF
jgi:hypothetical protein